jgi:subtilase family serine protease
MKPDLTITDISYSGGKVKFTVKNQGVLDSGAFDVKLYIGGALKDTVHIAGGIVAGGQATFTFTDYNHLCVVGSHYTVKVTADTGSAVNESDETNNSRSEYWGCPPAP